MIALQLVGSPTSTFFYNLSMLYSRDVITVSGFDNLFVTAYPNGTWSVGNALESDAKKLSLQEMITAVAGADIAVPHMFCDQGLTSTRIFFEEMLGIPIVGSSGHTAKIAQDKQLTKLICAAAGVPVPTGKLVSKSNQQAIDYKSMEYPVIIKPNNADNSDGLSLVKDKAELFIAMEKAFRFAEDVLIEEYVAGRELRGAVIEINGDFTVLPFIEYGVNTTHPIRNPEDKLKFDTDGKLLDQSEKLQIPATCPAIIENDIKNNLADLMIKAHQALKCRDFSMWDFRIDGNTNKPYLLEAGLFWSFSEKSMISNMIRNYSNLNALTSKIWIAASSRT